ncbi:hypothetical protein OG226_04970 [Streptomyces sp. NBC_01261]|uniref:hypothetical protein n=1 Tax=Streptomyces sp. NBC_01261 TaxID=2903802 RepID=UPI002E3466AC|nr:hypothetical protein [Streptomyces sp. NBC_01261]
MLPHPEDGSQGRGSEYWLAPGLDERPAGRRALAPDMQPVITFGVLGGEARLRGAFRTCRDALLDDPTSVPALPRARVTVPSQ